MQGGKKKKSPSKTYSSLKTQDEKSHFTLFPNG